MTVIFLVLVILSHLPQYLTKRLLLIVLTLTLSNDAVVTLDAADGVRTTRWHFQYRRVMSLDQKTDTFGDDSNEATLDLTIVSYTPDVKDLSGNAVATDLAISGDSGFDNITSHVIDTTVLSSLLQNMSQLRRASDSFQ